MAREPFSKEVGRGNPLIVSEPQSKAVKYLNPTEYSGVGRIEHEDLPVYSDLVLQLSAFPVPFLAGAALEVLILTPSSRLWRTFCNYITSFRKNLQIDEAGAVFSHAVCWARDL